MPILSRKKRVTATLFRQAEVVLDDEQTHVVLLLTSGKVEHRFALDLDSARTLTAGIERTLAEAEGD